MVHDMTAIIGASIFWVFIAVCAVASITSATLRHRETQKTIRQAIEKGQALDPATLDRLLQAGYPPKGPPPRGLLLFGGIMLLAVAGGLALIGWFSAPTNPAMLNQGLGAASMVGLIGAGLLVTAVLLRAPRGDKSE